MQVRRPSPGRRLDLGLDLGDGSPRPPPCRGPPPGPKPIFHKSFRYQMLSLIIGSAPPGRGLTDRHFSGVACKASVRSPPPGGEG